MLNNLLKYPCGTDTHDSTCVDTDLLKYKHTQVFLFQDLLNFFSHQCPSERRASKLYGINNILSRILNQQLVSWFTLEWRRQILHLWTFIGEDCLKVPKSMSYVDRIKMDFLIWFFVLFFIFSAKYIDLIGYNFKLHIIHVNRNRWLLSISNEPVCTCMPGLFQQFQISGQRSVLSPSKAFFWHLAGIDLIICKTRLGREVNISSLILLIN